MAVGSGLYIYDVVVKRSRSLSHLLMSSCLSMLYMAAARSSPGVVAIRYVLPVLWMTCYYVYNGKYYDPYSGMNFATKDRFRLNLLIYREVRRN